MRIANFVKNGHCGQQAPSGAVGGEGKWLADNGTDDRITRTTVKFLGMAHNVPVSVDGSRDPLTRMRVYRLAAALIPDAFEDAKALKAEPITQPLAGQLYSAVCSIEANISEGYSRTSGKDRARIFEYALGSVRESMSWYSSSTPIIGEPRVKDRLDRLEEMRRLLLAIIPRERGRLMK